MPLTNGQIFAEYKIIRPLGSGGMGEVYLAQHPRLPRRDALKLLPRDWSGDAEYRARFNREADLASTLWHPHIVGVHDRGEQDGQLWISMDFVDGLDAARLLADRFPSGMPVEDVTRIVTAVASALDDSHRQGLLHRDVKPANIMLTHGDDGREQRILLADFGIARDVNDISGLTTTNMTVGTVAYSAPEQLMGEDVDGRADQYALAATAYHMLTGAQLFPYSNPAVVISRHLNSVPPTLAGVRPELAALDSVLGKALSKHPDDRFTRCTDFANALAGDSATASASSPSAPTQNARRATKPKSGASETASGCSQQQPVLSASVRRRRWFAAAVATAFVLISAAGVVIWRPWVRSPSNATPAPASLSDQASMRTAAPPPPPAPPPPAPTFNAKSIDSVLLTADEINNLLGTYAMSGDDRIGVMKLDQSSYGMADNSALVKPPQCVGVAFGAEHEVYADTGFDAMRDQTFEQEPYVYNVSASAPTHLEQTVVVFPTSDQADAVMATAEKQWNSCASAEVDQKAGPESGYGWNLGSVVRQRDSLAVAMASNGAMDGAAACQQALGVHENVVVGARSCNNVPAGAQTGYDQVHDTWPTDPNWATSDAQRLAAAMLGKLPN